MTRRRTTRVSVMVMVSTVIMMIMRIDRYYLIAHLPITLLLLPIYLTVS